VTDPIADMLTRVRNAYRARHQDVLIPASKFKLEIAKILRAEGYIEKYDLMADGKQGTIRIILRYSGRKQEPALLGISRVSGSGLRRYAGRKNIPRVSGGMGTAILTTSQGVMCDRDARRKGVGGEVICYVW
jgi:small subunit ribosomal protein S8